MSIDNILHTFQMLIEQPNMMQLLRLHAFKNVNVNENEVKSWPKHWALAEWQVGGVRWRGTWVRVWGHVHASVRQVDVTIRIATRAQANKKLLLNFFAVHIHIYLYIYMCI